MNRRTKDIALRRDRTLSRLSVRSSRGLRTVLLSLAVLITVLTSSCQGRYEALPSRVTVAEVTMYEFQFHHDTVAAAGRHVFEVHNAGTLAHEMVLLSVPNDFPVSIDAQARSGTPAAFPTIAFLPPRDPGESGTFAVDLAPGRYALICFLKAPDQERHVLKGMSSELEVR